VEQVEGNERPLERWLPIFSHLTSGWKYPRAPSSLLSKRPFLLSMGQNHLTDHLALFYTSLATNPLYTTLGAA
jgi:hypothetical protein